MVVVRVVRHEGEWLSMGAAGEAGGAGGVQMQEMQRCRSNGEVGVRATCFSASALCVLLKQTA